MKSLSFGKIKVSGADWKKLASYAEGNYYCQAGRAMIGFLKKDWQREM